MIQRVRYALLVLVVAGSILNLWSTLDSVSRVPTYEGMVKAGYIQAPTPTRGIDWSKYGGTNTAATPNPIDALRKPATSTPIDWTQVANEQRQEAARGYYWFNVFPHWERATKIEFAVLVVALCIWLLLPAAKRQSS